MQYFNQTPSNQELIKLFHESKFSNFQKFLLDYWSKLEQSEVAVE
jgi:hypothetical protein